MNTLEKSTVETEKRGVVGCTDLLCAGLKWDVIEMKMRRGIYKLMGDGGVLYIGQSKNIEYRVACHIQAGKIPFKWVEFATCRKRDMDAIEKHLIEMHDPPYNYTHTDRAHAARGPRIGKWLKAHNAPHEPRGANDQKP